MLPVRCSSRQDRKCRLRLPLPFCSCRLRMRYMCLWRQKIQVRTLKKTKNKKINECLVRQTKTHTQQTKNFVLGRITVLSLIFVLFLLLFPSSSHSLSFSLSFQQSNFSLPFSLSLSLSPIESEDPHQILSPQLVTARKTKKFTHIVCGVKKP